MGGAAGRWRRQNHEAGIPASQYHRSVLWQCGASARCLSVGHAAADSIPVSQVHQGAGEGNDGATAEADGPAAAEEEIKANKHRLGKIAGSKRGSSMAEPCCNTDPPERRLRMPEATSNVEFAHKVHEQGHHHGPSDRRAQWIGIAEAVVLSIVAIATAWSGYQAAKWG